MAQDIFKYVDVALQSTYDGITTKDTNTLYGIQDTQRLYFGSALVSEKEVNFVASTLPATGKEDKIYVVNSGASKGIYRWNPQDHRSDPEDESSAWVGAYNNIVSISDFIVTSIRSSSSALDTVVPSEKAIATRIEALESNMVWKPAVANYAAIATTYPNPEEGWTVSTTDTNQIYRYDAGTTAWVNIFTLSADVVVPTGETGARNGLMTADMAAKLAGIETGAEVNQNAFSVITVGSTDIEAAAATDTVTFAGAGSVSVTASGSTVTFTGATTSDDFVLDNYAIASAKAALADDDTLTEAFGKLEYRIKAQEDALVTSLSSTSTDTEIPSAKAVYDAVKVVHM